MIPPLLGALATALLALTVGCAPAAYVRARTEPVVYAEPTSDAAPVEAIGIPRFEEMEPGLARGGQPTTEGLQFLRAQGYRTVVSFRQDSRERRALEGMGIRYVQIPLRAGLFSATPPTQEEVARFLSVVSDSSQRPVFIHCKRGKDRTGAMAAIYRIESGWTNEDAVREMLSFGFNRRYRKLMNFVRAYAREAAAVPAGP